MIAEAATKGLRPFIITDPTPWMDQLIETAGIMVRKCGGLSTEFVINNMLQHLHDPNHIILAVCEKDRPETLVGWLNAVYIHDTSAPWAEVWALWIKPGHGRLMRDFAFDTLMDWARHKGAKKLVAILTRNPPVMLKMFEAEVGFKQVGIVIEREL